MKKTELVIRGWLLAVLIALVNFQCIYAQTNETFVGVSDKDYTMVEVQLPISSNVPYSLDCFLATWLFNTDGTVTVTQAYQNYLKQYSKVLSRLPSKSKKVNQHHFILKWAAYEEGRYACVYVDMAQKNYSKNKESRKKQRWLLYDLKHLKRINMDDAFTLTAVSEINKNIGGTRHEILIKEPGKVAVQFLKDNKTMEATFSLQDHKQYFTKEFLELVGNTTAATTTATTTTTPQKINYPVYDIADEMPQYPGGPQRLFDYLNTTIKYPAQAFEEKKEGKVIIGFIVDHQGLLQDIHVVKGVYPSLDREALRAIRNMPAWNPGRKDGQFVAVRQTVPITFKLSSSKSTSVKSRSGSTSKSIQQASQGSTPQIASNDKLFTIIFANEHYQEEVPVEYAINDGERFRNCCINQLGIPKENIHFRKDATLNNMRREMEWIKDVANAYQGECSVLVYYAGHGIPDETNNESFLLPVDGSGTSVATGYSLQNFYQSLSELPAKNVTVFLDACFSGSNRGNGMLTSARGVAIKSKSPIPKGKVVVFSAAQGNETAYPYREKSNGLFTFYLLEKLESTQGKASLGELYNYVNTQVTRKSVVINRKKQTPQAIPSEEAKDWKSWKLK